MSEEKIDKADQGLALLKSALFTEIDQQFNSINNQTNKNTTAVENLTKAVEKLAEKVDDLDTTVSGQTDRMRELGSALEVAGQKYRQQPARQAEPEPEQPENQG